jgi:putative transposase
VWKQAGLQQRRRRHFKRRFGAASERLQRATGPNQVWSYDFLSVGTERVGRLRILAVMDEFTRECLALYVARSISSKRVIHLLGWLFATRVTPHYLRSDNGPEFVARAVQDWLGSAALPDPLYPSGQPMGERLYGEFQW